MMAPLKNQREGGLEEGGAEIACNSLINPLPSAENKLGKSKNERSEIFRGSHECYTITREPNSNTQLSGTLK